MNQTASRVEYALAQEDIAHYLTVCSRKFGMMRMRFVMFVLCGLVFMLAMTGILFVQWNGCRGLPYALCVAGALLSAGGVILYMIYPHVLKNQARELYQNNANYHYPMMVEFYPDVMVVSYRYMRLTYDWKSISSCCESTTHFCFLILPDGSMGVILPKSCLTQQQVENISQGIAGLFGNRHFKV